MNHIERSALGASIREICRHNQHLWWELKRQIWDGGYQTYYPRQGEYEIPVRRALQRLDPQSFEILASEWKKSNPNSEAAAETVARHYEAVIIEEIVRRAGIAAYRTNEW